MCVCVCVCVCVRVCVCACVRACVCAAVIHLAFHIQVLALGRILHQKCVSTYMYFVCGCMCDL